MTGFRIIVDRLRWGYYPNDDINPNRYPIEKNVEYVRVSCAGDEILSRQPDYLPFLYPERTAFWDQKRLVIPVLERIGPPLVTIQLATALVWRNRKFQSLPATQFLLATATGPWTFINPGETYNTPPGCFIMMRKDGKPLEAHARAVVNYCISVLDSMQLDGSFMEDNSIPESRRFGLAVLMSKAKSGYLMRHASSKGFKDFWENAKFVADGTKLKDSVISPLDI